MKQLQQYLIVCIFLLTSGKGFAQDLENFGSQDPVKLSGGVEGRTIFYNADGIANRREPFVWLISGNVNLQLYGWDIPISFSFTKEQESFSQPFNRYGLSPRYKWITLHAGYRNINFSPYTLAGYTILGGGIELKPKGFRFGLMYGRLNKAMVVDSISGRITPYSFSRRALATKIGVGNDKTFFDLHFLKAEDDSNSVDYMAYQGANRIMPASNAVVGFGTRINMFKDFFIEGDGALSAYTENINSVLELNDEDTERFSWLLPVNGSTRGFLAYSAGLGYKGKTFGVKAEYRHVDPDFKSMGAYYFLNDINSYTLAPNYTSPNGKFRFGANAGIQYDNTKNQKMATQKRFIASVNTGAQITERFGLDANFTNFTNNQEPNTLQIGDSLKIVQTSTSAMLMPRYTLMREKTSHTWFASAGFTVLDDFNNYYAQGANKNTINTGMYMLSYMANFTKISLNSYINLQYTTIDSPAYISSYQGGTLGANKSLFKQTLNVGASFTYLENSTQGAENGHSVSGSFNLGYRIGKAHQFRAAVYYTKNNPGTAIMGGVTSYSESRAELTYQYRFDL